MNKEKFKLKGSIHTLEIRHGKPLNGIRGLSTDDGQDIRGVTTGMNRNGEYVTVINPNKVKDEDIFTFEKLKDTMQMVVDSMGIDTYMISRADFRFDSYDSEHYEQYQKLYRYLLSALDENYTIRNKYRASDIYDESDQKSLSYKNDTIECEHYNREYKNAETGNVKELAKSRFEERSKRSISLRYKDGYVDHKTNMKYLKDEFANKWISRWEKALKTEQLEQIQETWENELVNQWFKGSTKKPIKYPNINSFIAAKQQGIFTMKEFEKILFDIYKSDDRMGEVTSSQIRYKMRYYKKTYGMEYIGKKDVEYALRELKRATKEYFN